MMVKKSKGKWRTCIDFSNSNDAFPKELFPLPKIDHLVNGTTGHEILSFIDAYSGYNKKPIHVSDQDHTSFIMT